ncbi:MAG: hypothetical protein ACK4UU_05690, partial [Fimbriimonadales bacterium]
AGVLECKNLKQSLEDRFARYFKSDPKGRPLWQRIFSGTLDELVPETDVREPKKQIAFIYGDGSNFGQITRKLDSLGVSLQWTRRAELVNRAAIALALSQALHNALSPISVSSACPTKSWWWAATTSACSPGADSPCASASSFWS